MNPFVDGQGGVPDIDQEEAKPTRCSSFSTRTILVVVIYVSFLLDNVLLTVIVPILPDFLLNGSSSSLLYKKYDLELMSNILLTETEVRANVSQEVSPSFGDNGATAAAAAAAAEENVAIGVLLAAKAFVQLVFNPIIGVASKRIGYHWPILMGTISLVLSSVLFAVGDNYYSLLFARSVQGIGSSCIGVCGMSLVATLYPEEEKRSKVMGIVLGSIALGVLIGYPVGGILYDLVGKSSPFWIISTLLVAVVCVQVRYLSLDWADLRSFGGGVTGAMDSPSNSATDAVCDPKWCELLTDFEIKLITLAIFISTSAMAILEPCLPLWLLTNLHPQKWQLGTVFIPDSLGYLIGTNGFGKLAFEWGQTRVGVVALAVVGCSCIIIPGSSSMSSLMIPHFGLGLGIGILDAALVPYLSSRIDAKYAGEINSDCSASDSVSSSYGTVYAIQQMAVSLAYSVSPLLASEVVKFIGFPMLMLSIGVLNVGYAVLFYYFTTGGPRTNKLSKTKDLLLATTKVEEGHSSAQYNRFYNTMN